MITKFQQFVNEALLPSQFRKYVKAFDRERYEKVFQELKAKYDGDRNAYRIYVPLLSERTISELEKEIEAFFKDNNLEITDYEAGECKFIGAKNTSKISKILNRMNKDLFDRYVIERAKKGGTANDDLLVCISRHPYDIAGSDTDRDWTDCMTMKSSVKSPRIVKMKEERKEIIKKLKEVTGLSFTKYKNEKDYPYTDKYSQFVTDARNLNLSREDKDKTNTLLNKMREIDESIKDRKEEGQNAHYLINEVEEGSLMSYLIKKTDKNITNPLTVLNIKPYHNKGGQTILGSSDSMYGKENPEFKKTVDAILKEINGDAKGAFKLNTKVYHDNEPGTIIHGDILELESDDLEDMINSHQISYENIVKLIKDERFDPKKLNFSMIEIITRNGENLELIQTLLDKGEDVNKGEVNRSPLANAIRNRSLPIIKLLFKNGYKVKEIDNRFIITASVIYNCNNILKFILKKVDVSKIVLQNYYMNTTNRLENVSILDHAIIYINQYSIKDDSNMITMNLLDICKSKCQFNNWEKMKLQRKLKTNNPVVIEMLKEYKKI